MSPETVSLTMDQLASRVAELVQDRRTLLGITGAPGAGKSTVAGALVASLGRSAALVAMDGFHLAQQELRRLGRADRKGAPDTFDSWGYAALLQRLKANAEPVVYAPLFRRDIEEPIGSCVLVERDVGLIVTEGNYLLLDTDGWREARRQLDEVWFLEVDDTLRVQRLVRRHEEFGKSPSAARDWATGSDARNAELVETTRARADVIVQIVEAADVAL